MAQNLSYSFCVYTRNLACRSRQVCEKSFHADPAIFHKQIFCANLRDLREKIVNSENFPYLATFKNIVFLLIFMSCWNVGNLESFPYFNRNFVGARFINESCGRMLLYSQTH
jgi:hypothetical protein